MKIEFLVEDKRWTKFIEIADLEALAKKILSSLVKLLGFDTRKGTILEMTIMLTNDRKISSLNRKYRHIDRPTDVLSFPIYEKEFGKYFGKEKCMLLGDIVISLETLKNESSRQGKSFRDHLAHLTTHGILHLMGFDHTKPTDAKRMVSIETLLLHKADLAGRTRH